MNILKGKTESGFKYEMDADKLDDMRVVKLLGMTDTDVTKIPLVIETLLGADQEEKLYQFVEKLEGKATVTKTSEIFIEILNDASAQSKEVKKD